MRTRSLLALPLAALATLAAGPRVRRRDHRHGKPAQGSVHANSICAFSGLEDGDGAGFPGPGGAPPQNWGHVQQAERAAGATPADLKASGFQPGDSCNGHRGFYVNPPPGGEG